MRKPTGAWLWAAALSGLGFVQAHGDAEPRYGPRLYGPRPSVVQLTELGRQIFSDRSLSASGRLACASCHDPANAYGPPNGGALQAVQRGGPVLDRPGTRAVPSLRYLVTTIPFTEHYIDDEDGHGVDGGPTGGLTWDGRVQSAHAQALIPLFAPNEMANESLQALAARVRQAPYAAAFRQAVSAPGQDVFDHPEQVVGWLGMALEVFQQDAAEFYPFSSKYDAFLRHRATLSAQEQRGLALFNDPGKGNCAACHISTVGAAGGMPVFTDLALVALGVPRNPDIPANGDPAYFDLGLCGPLRTDLRDHADYCGRFKTPTLRNVATRHVFFHNGVFHSLRQAVDFYAQRDTAPQRWYRRDAAGRVQPFDDLPEADRGNVNTEPPFGGVAGDAPRLNAREVDDLVAFLGTLTDGYRPAAADAR